MQPWPPLVTHAVVLAGEPGAARACDPAVGALLHLLAAQRGRLRVGSIGTGVGIGAAWLVSGLPPSVPFVAVEPDAVRAGPAERLFSGDDHVRILAGDWREVLPIESPFDLLVADVGAAAHPDVDPGAVPGLLAPGGTVVVHGFGLDGAAAASRARWLRRPDLVAVEVVVSEQSAVVLGVRTR
jgi:predicted O-methyltransferase YrrM